MEDLKIIELLSKTKAGKIRLINDRKIKVVAAKNGCEGCTFRTMSSCRFGDTCMSVLRKDKTSVIFVERGKKAVTGSVDIIKKSLAEIGSPFLIIKRDGMRFGSMFIPNKNGAEYELILLSDYDRSLESFNGTIIPNNKAEKLISLGIHEKFSNGYGSIYDFFGFKEANEKANRQKDQLIQLAMKL